MQLLADAPERVERVDGAGLTGEQFERDYLLRSAPVVLTGLDLGAS